MEEVYLMNHYVKKWRSKIKPSTTEVQGSQFATELNELINGNKEVTADKNRKQYKPTLVLSVIGDSNTFVPNQWPKDVFQKALIETAKSEKETWILYRSSTDGVSKLVEEAYKGYKTEVAVCDQKQHIKLIDITAIKGENSSTKILQNEEDDPSFLDFETLVSNQNILYFGPNLIFKIPVPTAIIICEGGIHTIAHISKALKNQLPVIIMKGSGKAADLVLDYLDECKCKRIVIKKKVRFLFGDKFDEEEYKRMKGHLKYIKQNRELVGVFDLHKDNPLKLSSIVGEAVVSIVPMKNVQIKEKGASQSGSDMRERLLLTPMLFNGLDLKTKAYVMDPKFSTPTSLPLYFSLGYKVLQENEDFMKDCGKVFLLEALQANRCEYVSSLMDQGVAIESRDLHDLYKWHSKSHKTLLDLFFGTEYEKIIQNEDRESEGFVNTVRKACRKFLRYEEGKYSKPEDISIGDVLLWAIIFNRRELAEICWQKGKDQLLAGLVCFEILKTFSEEVRAIEDGLADALEEHSKIFEQRCTFILDKINDENTDEAMDLLDKCASVWGIWSSPLAFAYEHLMYDVVAHTCSKKYVHMHTLNNYKTPGVIKTLVLGPVKNHIFHFIWYLLGLLICSWFVLTSTNTEYNVQGPARSFEYYVYIWRFGDLLEEVLECCGYRTEPVQHSKLHKRLRFMNYFTNFWNFLDWLSHFTFGLALFLRHLLQEDGQTYARNMFALSLLFMYLRFLEAFLSRKSTGIAVIMILQMLKELRKYIFIVLFLVLGVGIYYHANLWPDHPAMWSGSLSNWRILTILSHPYWQIFGEVDLETLTGSNQDNCSNNRSIWEADPSTERCPQQDWTVPVIAGLYMMFTNLLVINIIIANFSNTYENILKNSERLWHFHLYTVMKDYSKRSPSPINLIYRPIQMMIRLKDKHRTKRKIDGTLQRNYQQGLQKHLA